MTGPGSPDTSDDTGAGPDREPTTSSPRWVRIFGIIAAIVILLIAILLLTGGHGPRRHTPSGGLGQTPVASLPQSAM